MQFLTLQKYIFRSRGELLQKQICATFLERAFFGLLSPHYTETIIQEKSTKPSQVRTLTGSALVTTSSTTFTTGISELATVSSSMTEFFFAFIEFYLPSRYLYLTAERNKKTNNSYILLKKGYSIVII